MSRHRDYRDRDYDSRRSYYRDDRHRDDRYRDDRYRDDRYDKYSRYRYNRDDRYDDWYRRRYRSYSRSRSRSRSPYSDEERRHYDREYTNDRKDRRDKTDRNDYRESRHDKKYDNSTNYQTKETDHQQFTRSKEPSNSLILKGLAPHTVEDELQNEIFRTCGLIPTNVKVVRDRITGECKGFGFLDFESTEQAKLVMETTGGSIYIGELKVIIEYSNKLQTSQIGDGTFKDWLCEACNARNFHHRKKCFKCSALKTPRCQEVVSNGEKPEYYGKPTVELIIRNLSATTTEDTLRSIYNEFAPVKAVKIVRDRFTNMSKKFAFVEFDTVEEATFALHQSKGLTIDGNLVTVGYAKRAHLGPEPSIEDQLALAAWNAVYDYTEDPTEKDKHIKQQLKIQSQHNATTGYVYDKNTGYYYNEKLNYYYDGNTGYYYDANTQIWMYYNSTTCEFIPLQNQEQSKEQTKEQTKEQKTEESQKKKKKTKLQEVLVMKSSLKTKKDTLNNIMKWNQKKKELQESLNISKETKTEKKEEPTQTQEATKPQNEDSTEQPPMTTSFKIKTSSHATTIGRGFVPNPLFEETMKKLEETEAMKEFQRFQEKITKLTADKKKKKKKRKREEVPQQATMDTPLPEENKGSKMLKLMGWKEGEGLGKTKSGITAPITVSVRETGAGLGFKSNTVDDPSLQIQPGDKYSTIVRKKMAAKFAQL